MDTARLGRFQHARRFERELNGRQREILDRIARGQTNAEIAAACGMTFDGAKWNVSEILSKLGLDSREDAAAYWRWRQSLRARLRSLAIVPMPASFPARILAGAGLPALALVVVILLARDGDSPLPPVDLGEPYHMVVRSETMSMAGTEAFVTTIDWQDDTHLRKVVERTSPDGTVGTTTIVRDGTYEWWDNTESSYGSRTALDPDHLADILGPPIGRWERQQDIPALLRTLREELESPLLTTSTYSRVTGTSRILGRRVTVIQYEPVVLVMETQTEPDGSQTVVTPLTGSGTGTLWVEEASMTVLRFDTTGEVTLGAEYPSSSTVMTEFVQHPNFPAGTFTYALAPGHEPPGSTSPDAATP